MPYLRKGHIPSRHPSVTLKAFHSTQPTERNCAMKQHIRTLRTSLVNLCEYIEDIGLADFNQDIKHPEATKKTDAPVTSKDWVIKTAMDIDLLNIQIRRAIKARRKAQN